MTRPHPHAVLAVALGFTFVVLLATLIGIGWPVWRLALA